MPRNVLTSLSKHLVHFFLIGISSTIVGVVCKDGIILGAEKVIRSKLLMAGTDARLYNVDTHVGMVCPIINQFHL